MFLSTAPVLILLCAGSALGRRPNYRPVNLDEFTSFNGPPPPYPDSPPPPPFYDGPPHPVDGPHGRQVAFRGHPQDAPPRGTNDYTYLTLAVQWGPGVCADGYQSNRPCIPESKRTHWTIHGLWPSGDYSSPEFCTTEAFDGRKLEEIKAQLNQYWPSLTSTKDRYFTFWRHEWQKHGTCAGDVPQLRGLVPFFKNVLSIFQRMDVKKYLDNSNVKPSKTQTYSPDQIKKAISDDFPYNFDIVCTQAQSKNKPVLSEIRFCLGKDLKPVHCRGKVSRCANQVYYPE